MSRVTFTGRRGTLLVEILFAIALASATILIAARLLQSIARVYRDAPSAAAALQTQSQWLRLMRDDAWAARSFEARADDLTLHFDGDRTIVWHVADGLLERTAADDDRRWPDARPICWSSPADELTLTVGDDDVRLATPTASAGREP